MKASLLVAIVMIFSASDNDLKLIDLGQFSIEVPDSWEYREAPGIDSFVGSLIGPSVELSFDCSGMGYANPLIEAPAEYAEKVSKQFSIVFMKPGVIYTTGDVEEVRKEHLKKIKKKDRAKLKVEPTIVPTRTIYKPSGEELEKYKNADFMVALKHRDSVVVMPIVLPANIKMHNILIDTVDNYVIKLIWPKKPGDGMTGAYYKKLGGSFNLQIHGINLRIQDQDDAIRSFKTIKIKE